MNKKYIVKNCPARRDAKIFGYSCSHIATLHCYDQPDCLIKQVIEKCKKECDPTNDDWCRVKENLSNEILQLFEIEECE